jgi:hypothetical protein
VFVYKPSFTAQHSGTCPCGKFIRAGVSMIAAVDVPLPPDPRVCHYSGERRQWFVDSVPGNVRPRRWLHEKCAARLEGHTFADLEMLAADRRQALKAIKRVADLTYGRQHGRRRHAGSRTSLSDVEASA